MLLLNTMFTYSIISDSLISATFILCSFSVSECYSNKVYFNYVCFLLKSINLNYSFFFLLYGNAYIYDTYLIHVLLLKSNIISFFNFLKEIIEYFFVFSDYNIILQKSYNLYISYKITKLLNKKKMMLYMNAFPN